MQKKNVTIYDIAREAGVSPATVSRILTGSTSVSQEKRERVTQLIEQYNFRPNAMARALTETRTKLIGMVIADTINPYYTSVYAACGNDAYQRGYVTMLLNTYSTPEMEVSALTKLREQRVDAIIICGGRIDLHQQDPDFTRLLEGTLKSTPIVVGTKSPDPRIHGVGLDHAGAVDVAMDYLLGLGHRDIGFIYTGTPYNGTWLRLSQFRRRMAQAGLPVREEWLIHVDRYDSESGRQGIEQLMALPKRPTALLGMNDMVSIGMLQGLLAHGLRVPEDMSVMAFDDTFITAITTPRLTAVGCDYREYARMLVDAAVGAMEGRTMPRDQMIRPVLSVKESCAPPVRRP